MKKINLLLLISILLLLKVNAQTSKNFTPKIETCECQFKADKSLITKCGYLLVPENRKVKNSRIIKLPYIYVASANPNKKNDPVLYTSGGPGGSTLNAVESIHYFEFMKDRDFIAFEQRGTKYALPCLECEEVNKAIKESYTKNLSKDSLINVAVKKCRKKLTSKGIDLNGYDTSESTDDIEDLRKLLKIDSINLFGKSYSGGLMLNVLRKYPKHVRSLILDSPLPMSINIDEDELANFNEVLHKIMSENNETSLQENFQKYFLSINDKKFETLYFDVSKNRTVKIYYSRNELIDIIGSKIDNEDERKKIPKLLKDLIDGEHKVYIDDYLNNVFNDQSVYSGMRLSVYCSDKMAFADQIILNQQYQIYPFMKGYKANDVTLEMCQCWNVQPITPENKMAFYSNVPILLGAGSFDPSCRPIYNDILNRYYPNSQKLLFQTKAHGPLISLEGNQFIANFLNNPLKRITSEIDNIKAN